MSTLGLDEGDADALRAGGPMPPAAHHVEYAGWWVRVGAYLIDVVILVVGLFIVAAVASAISSALAVAVIVISIVVMFVGYWTYFEGSESGQTIGKRACGIRVRDDSGGRATYGQALGRNLVARVIGLFPIVGLIDVLWPIWDSDKQCLHDKAASTIVVRV